MPRACSKHITTACATALIMWLALAPSSLAANSQAWNAVYQQGVDALSSETPTVAVDRFRKSVELVKKQSKDPADLDKCLMKLSASLMLIDKTEEARTIMQQMLSRLSKKGAGNARTTPVLMTLGSIEESAGNHPLAMDYYNRALHISEKNYGTYSPEAAVALHGLGRVYNKMGKRDEAASNYQRAITILSKDANLEAAAQLKKILHDYGDLVKGGDDSNRELIKDFQQDILKQGSPTNKPAGAGSAPPQQSQFQQQTDSGLSTSRSSETNLNELVALRGFQTPESDASLKPAFKAVSDNVFGQNRYRMGEEQYERMIATDIDSLGPNHPSVGNDLNGLAQLYIGQGRYQDAKKALTRALSIYKSAYRSDNVLSINTTAALAFVEYKLGNFDESSRLYREALSNAQETLGPNSLETAKILNGLAFLYFQQGQLDKASTFYEWAVASTEKAVGAQDPLLAACLKDYAQVLRRLDKTTKAAEVELRAGKILNQ